MSDNAVLEEIKYRNDIVDVISGYVKLKKTGANFSGLCPFHSEKTPSFVVFPSTSNFYCFGCGAGGDVITFVMREENLSFPEALESLAKRAGIELPEARREGESGAVRSRILQMNKEAARFFHACLKDTKKYPQGMAYLSKRGLPMPVIRRFGLGYAPDEPFVLQNYLREKGFTEKEMLEGFLCGKTKSKRTGKDFTYDYFRGRVIFPIIDLGGNVVAFGGRIIGEGEPKYLNSSDTPAFKKRRTLFALNFAKNFCAEQMILCEGYMDVIALHKAGFQNAVATLGTAITPEHARLMKRYTKSVIISYDSDAAGQRAADKAFRLLSEVGLDTRILKVEDAKDPDEYIKKNSAEGFRRFIEKSKSRFDFQFDGILSKYDPEQIGGKIKASEELTALIASYPSAVERELYIKKTAKALDVPADALSRDVEKARRKSEKQQSEDTFRKIANSAVGYGDRVNPDYAKNPAAGAAEEAVLGLLLLNPEYVGKLQKEALLSEEDFQTAFNRRIFGFLIENAGADGSFEESLLSKEFSGEEMGRIIKMKVRRLSLTENGEAQLIESAKRLRASKKKGDRIEDIGDILGDKRKKSRNTESGS